MTPRNAGGRPQKQERWLCFGSSHWDGLRVPFAYRPCCNFHYQSRDIKRSKSLALSTQASFKVKLDSEFGLCRRFLFYHLKAALKCTSLLVALFSFRLRPPNKCSFQLYLFCFSASDCLDQGSIIGKERGRKRKKEGLRQGPWFILCLLSSADGIHEIWKALFRIRKGYK